MPRGSRQALLPAARAPLGGIAILDGAPRPGAKILVSGGGRCNVTNSRVGSRDFWGGRRGAIRRVLEAFSAADAAAFFRDAGVPLHEEAGGKLFPDSNRARDVLDALLREAAAAGATLHSGTRITAIAATESGFRLETTAGDFLAASLVLATGGRSLPKTGSDGAGYGFAQALGHTVVPTSPALVPLVLAGDRPTSAIHTALSGVALEAAISVWIDERLSSIHRGPMLWTHFGVSGPVVLDASRHWARAVLEVRPVRLTVNLLGDRSFADVEHWLMDAGGRHPRTLIRTLLAAEIPDRVAAAILESLAIALETAAAAFPRVDRRRLVHALTAWPLDVAGTRGYSYAEATAGGVDLGEIDPTSMASRRCPGLYLVGEILDVDGRLGGFNFQWAWSSAFVAARGLAARAAAASANDPASSLR